MIPGAVPSGNTLTVTAPYDDSIIATLDTANAAAVKTALNTAQQLFADRSRWLSAAERIAILKKTAELMDTQADDLAMEAAREGGKPLMDSRVEVARAIDGVHNCIECIRGNGGREIPMGTNLASQGRLAFTRKEPIGVVVAVSAFNHPLNLIVHQVGPAVASGCPVIIKPAQDTPLSCYRFVALLREAGLPEAWCQALVVSDLDVASQLVSDSRVGFFSFIGSAAVGWMLRSKLAPGARCALEHGGAAPVIIEADADLDDALPLIAKGGFYHGGQVCVSVQRVFCHCSIASEVADRLSTLAQAQVVGDPTDPATEVGPLIRAKEVDRVQQWVSEAVAAGAELLTGGEVHGHCYSPTVLFNPPQDAKVSNKEIFGPVICVYDYVDMDEALGRANALPVAFQAAVFTRSMDKALQAYRGFDASAVMINDHTAFRVDWMPFAGLRQSGLGVGGIPYTYRDMQIEKLMVIRSRVL
ncbi:MAG TPA: aldehyde dehydrogenase family protein [Acidiferrobacteraceae bacterium]|nr:aldehyde dehydrogenase family protein [Acidiferrobacteraceae bacterium]